MWIFTHSKKRIFNILSSNSYCCWAWPHFAGSNHSTKIRTKNRRDFILQFFWLRKPARHGRRGLPLVGLLLFLSDKKWPLLFESLPFWRNWSTMLVLCVWWLVVLLWWNRPFIGAGIGWSRDRSLAVVFYIYFFILLVVVRFTFDFPLTYSRLLCLVIYTFSWKW